MKTLLLASTALVATAGIAAAEIKITGWAEIGIIGGDKYATDQWHTDIDVNFAMTGESDGGLAFGASVDLDENGAFNNTTQGGETYFLSYGALRLDMGDTDGALDKVMKEVNVAAGSIADDETSHAGFNGNSGLDGLFDGQNATVSYSASGFTAAISAQIDDTGVQTPVWGLGVRYATDLGGAAIGVGLGYQTQEDTADLIGLSLDAAFGGGFSAAINYTNADIVGQSDDGTHMAIGVGYKMNALAVGVNYGEYTDWSLGCGDCSGFGLAATYDLGGGLSAQFGYGDSDFGGGVDSNSYSLGLSMSF
jgi:outer membrane protein OmpU